MGGWSGGGDPQASPTASADLSLPAPASCSLAPRGAGGVEVVSGSSCVSPAGGIAAELQPQVVVPRWAALGSPSSEKVGRAQRFICILFSNLLTVSRGRTDVAVSGGSCDVRFVFVTSRRDELESPSAARVAAAAPPNAEEGWASWLAHPRSELRPRLHSLAAGNRSPSAMLKNLDQVYLVSMSVEAGRGNQSVAFREQPRRGICFRRRWTPAVRCSTKKSHPAAQVGLCLGL